MLFKSRPKYFNVEQAIAMLPLIRGYCRDIKWLANNTRNLQNRKLELGYIKSKNIKKQQRIDDLIWFIDDKIETRIKTYKRWYKELSDMGLSICSNISGLINIPVKDKFVKSVIFLCISCDSCKENLRWHTTSQNYKDSKIYWEA